MALYSEFENFGKLAKYSYGPKLPPEELLPFFFFVIMYNSCLFPKVKKTLLRGAQIGT
jgi:hypothetical protein